MSFFQPGEEIGAAARGVRHDQMNGLRGIGLRAGGLRMRQRAYGNNGSQRRRSEK